MAGFKKTEPYFVPEMDLELPHSLEYIQNCLLPCLPTWKEQRTGRRGDKSEAADNFLNELILYLTEVLCTSGIHFIVEFPQHPVTQLLLSIPGFAKQAFGHHRVRPAKARRMLYFLFRKGQVSC